MELDLTGIPKSDQAQVKNDIGEFLVEQVLKYVSQSQSPVQGESWPKLSKDYAAFKKSEGGTPIANMEFSGDLLDSLDFKNTRAGVEIGFFDSEAWKADGHLKFSGAKNHTPQRRFLPAEGQQFKNDIQREIEKIILDAKVSSSDFPASELKEIDTTSNLYDYLSEKLGLDSRSEIKMAVLRDTDLVDRLDKYDLLALL